MEEKYFELAVVISCSEQGCRVRPAQGPETLDVVYTARMKNRVMIHPGQLLAINLQTHPPEILWRWYRMQIASFGAEDLVLDDRGVRQVMAQRAPGFDTDLAVGDWVWAGGISGSGPDERWEAVERISPEGGLSQPDRVRRLVFPFVVNFYNQAAA